MNKTSRANILILVILLPLIALGSACGYNKASAQKPSNAETVRTRPTESPTPAYKPLKRVSRDVIDSDDKKEEKQAPVKIKANK